MPCRALEAFGRASSRVHGAASILVLMPCRALEAFGRTNGVVCHSSAVNRLNALSGIGGVRTMN